MKGCVHSREGWLIQVVGSAALILVVAGALGIPYSVAAAAVLGAVTVLIVNP